MKAGENNLTDFKSEYKRPMDDPHYDPPDPYARMFSLQESARTSHRGMTHENRQAMMAVLFSEVNPSLLSGYSRAAHIGITAVPVKAAYADADDSHAKKSEASSSSSSVSGDVKGYEDG